MPLHGLLLLFALSSLVRTVFALGVLVPLYVYPDTSCASWSTVNTAISAHSSVQWYIIVNPNNGPATDSLYENCVASLSSSTNQVVMGFIDTTSGQVESDIDIYAGWPDSSRPTGIYFDNISPSDSELSTYQGYVSYAKSKGFSFIGLDPGQAASDSYISLGDIVNTYESSYSGFNPSSLSGTLSKQSVILTNAPSSGSYSSVISQLESLGVGAVYISDFGDSSSSIPTQFSEFVDEVVSASGSSSTNNAPSSTTDSTPTTGPSTNSPTGTSNTNLSNTATATNSATNTTAAATNSNDSTKSISTGTASNELASSTQSSSSGSASGDGTTTASVSSSSKRSSPVGGIVGGVLAAVIVILALLAARLCMNRRRHRAVRRDREMAHASFSALPATGIPSFEPSQSFDPVTSFDGEPSFAPSSPAAATAATSTSPVTETSEYSSIGGPLAPSQALLHDPEQARAELWPRDVKAPLPDTHASTSANMTRDSLPPPSPNWRPQSNVSAAPTYGSAWDSIGGDTAPSDAPPAYTGRESLL